MTTNELFDNQQHEELEARRHEALIAVFLSARRAIANAARTGEPGALHELDLANLVDDLARAELLNPHL